MAVQEIAKCTARCKTCKHHTNVTGVFKGEGNIACAYILDTFERRGCPAGDKCDKYESGRVSRFKQTYKEMRNVYL